MESMSALATAFILALLRYLPAVVLPGMTPLKWAPGLIRLVLAMALAWLTVLAMPQLPELGSHAGYLVLAGLRELAIGMAFGLVVMIPQGALHFSGWVLDMQAGLSAGALFDPGAQGSMQSALGSAIGLLATVLFFTLDLHLELYRTLVASTQVLPLGMTRPVAFNLSALFGLLGSSFLLAFIVVAPVMLSLFAVDVGVAYATRSMPQANVYFLVLPLKIAMAILLLAASLPFMPVLIGRVFRDAFDRLPAVLGA